MSDIVTKVTSSESLCKLFGADSANTSSLTQPVGSSNNAGSNTFRPNSLPQFNILAGVVLDTLPMNHTYRVALSNCAHPIVCQVLGTVTGGSQMGNTCIGYPAGASVLVAYNGYTGSGVILGGYAVPGGLENFAYRTTLSGLVRRYDTTDYTHYSIITKYDGKYGNGSFHASNFAYDEHTDVPEWGVSYLTGNKMFIDPYMILIGTDDYTNLSFFYRDSLLRLSAINYQRRTFGCEEECLVDNYEYIEYKGTSIMPYEHYGFHRLQEKLIEDVDRDVWYQPDSRRSPYEPSILNIKPFHRVMEFGGWLGQGKLIQVIPPVKDVNYLEFNKKVEPRTALSRFQMDVSGRLSVGTTKGISITKYGCLPTAERIYRPDEIKDDEGDNSNNYKHKDLKLPLEIKKTAKSPSMQEAMGIMDYSGYNKNWNDIFQLAYHARDYQLDEESKLEQKSINAPQYSELAGKYLLSEDKTYDIEIDKDRTYSEYTQNEAGIHLLPSGGIVIYDGSGSEIRFVKGQITISCAGDINIRPGRDLNLWGGHDLIAKSNNNLELSSSNGTVRVKAERDLKLLGANNGGSDCGVIIESKSGSKVYDFTNMGDQIITNGIVLKSSKSPVAMIGNIAYLRCGDGNTPGQGVYIDAGEGKSDIVVLAKSFTEYIDSRHSINFDKDKAGDVEYTTLFSKDLSLLLGRNIMTNGLVLDGDLIMSKNIACCGTITSFGNQSGLISPFGLKTKEKYMEYIDKNTELPEEKYPKYYTSLYESTISPTLYNEKCIGNSVVIAGIGFSFRTDEQLALPGDYYVYEDLWQHIAASSGGAGKTWVEQQVVCTAGTTYPYPGKLKYMQPSYITQETVIADFVNCRYIDRQVGEGDTEPGESKYKDPKYGDQHPQSLNSYPVVK